jgi:hypothetical protein
MPEDNLLDVLESLDSTSKIVKDVSRTSKLSLPYPILLMNNVSDVEIRYFRYSGLLFGAIASHEPSSVLPVFYKEEKSSYVFIGNVEFSLHALNSLCKFREHDIVIRKSKTESIPITDQIIDTMLLER